MSRSPSRSSGVGLTKASAAPAKVVFAGGVADSAAINAAVAAMRLGNGKLTGHLIISGSAVLDTAVTIDGGYVNTTLESAGQTWTASTPEQFRLTVLGSITPAAGVGVGLTLSGFWGLASDIQVQDGGWEGNYTDGAITAGSNVLTSATAAAAAKVGQHVVVGGAGNVVGGITRELVSRVVSVGSGTITLDVNAVTSVASGGAVRLNDVAVELRNAMRVRHRQTSKNYAGVCFRMDATDSTTHRVRNCNFTGLWSTDCGQGLAIRKIESFGSLGQVMGSGNLHGDYFGFTADTGWEHYENGVGTANYTVPYYVWMEGCNAFNGGIISFGDRATEAAIVATGPASDLGRFNQIRATAYAPSNVQTMTGLRIIDVNSCDITAVQTSRCLIGVEIIGSNVNINGRHKSLTTDRQSLVVRGSTFNATPRVDVAADYRFVYGEPVYIDSTVGAGWVKVRGHLRQPNIDAAGGTYYVDCQSTTCQLDVAGLTTETASGVGDVYHPDMTKVRGLNVARLANTTAAKGDLYAGGSALSGNSLRLAVGSNGQVLTADSTAATGVKWATTAAGAGTVDTPGVVPPALHSYLAWSLDPAVCALSSCGPATGKPQYYLIPVPSDITVNNLSLILATAGTAATFTSGQNFLALYDSTGTRLGVSADISATIGAQAANTELKASIGTNIAITGGNGVYVYAVVLLNWSAGTAPLFSGLKQLSAAMQNVGMPSGIVRAGSDSVSRTATVTSKAITALSLGQGLAFAALS